MALLMCPYEHNLFWGRHMRYLTKNKYPLLLTRSTLVVPSVAIGTSTLTIFSNKARGSNFTFGSPLKGKDGEFLRSEIGSNFGKKFSKVSGLSNQFRKFSSFGNNSSDRIRSIGISAHIDSGKTTLTERILFYCGRISEMHEVRGSDGVGAKMDSMDLEREKGITIQSAATYCDWEVVACKEEEDSMKGAYSINIIDTPGHVDFTIEVERALRVLDGAVLVCCGVAGVQSQTLTVDRQMKRYSVPRVIFVNKLDRDGADPWRAMDSIRRKLGVTTCALQIPIGLEGKHLGIVDLVSQRCAYFIGSNGSVVRYEDTVPQELLPQMTEKRMELLETLAVLDDYFAEVFAEDPSPSQSDIHSAIRRLTIKNEFVPLVMGSAKANKGVQLLLDAVCRYLPSPGDREQVAFDVSKGEEEIILPSDPNGPLIAMAFKVQELPISQLTYLRIYSGRLRRGDVIFDSSSGKKAYVKKLLRMHSNEAREVASACAGEIVAVAGLDCISGVTFTDGKTKLAMESYFIPEPVVSLAIKDIPNDQKTKLAKALHKFQREDPTFRVVVDEESKETVLMGMGELHLSIYKERMAREYGLILPTGEPKVSYREMLTERAYFDYTHKKQSGGAGQYGKVHGYFEPLDIGESIQPNAPNIFVNEVVGNDIPPNFIPYIERGFKEAAKKGVLSGHPLINTKFVLQGGKAHDVDSSEFAFRLAAAGALRAFIEEACPIMLEPIMKVEVNVPLEFQAAALSTITRRKGNILHSICTDGFLVLEAEVALKNMFGYITDLRACTQGQGDFSMTFERYQQMNSTEQEDVIKKTKQEQ